MIRIRTLALVALAWSSVACSVPWEQKAPTLHQASLTLRLTSPVAQGRTEGRLLLATAQVVRVTLTQAGKEVSKSSQPLLAGATSVTFGLEVEALTEYDLKAEATNASGTLLFAGETALILDTDLRASLYLLPVKPDGSTGWPSVQASDQVSNGSSGSLTSLAAGSSTSFKVQLGNNAQAFVLASLPAGLLAYAQRLDGKPLSPESSRITRASLSGDETFWLTYYSPSSVSSLSSLGRFDIPVKTVTLTPDKATLFPGATQATSFAFAPHNADKQAATDFAWSTSDSTVATVDASGLITAVAAGKATITLASKTVDTAKGTVAVTVAALSNPVTSVSLTPAAPSLNVGDTVVLTPTILPANADLKVLKWTSSNPAVATVVNGTVTAVAKGSAVITAAATDNSGKTATATVTVVQPVTSVTLDAATKNLGVGDTFTPVATVAPATASNLAVTWSSSAPSIASVDPATGKVTALASGVAIIIATSADGTKSASVTVTVTISANLTLVIAGPEALAFNLGTATIDQGTSLVVSTTNTTLASTGTGWSWLADGVAVTATQAGSQFTINTAGLAPGSYNLDVFVTYNGVYYSGSITLAVQPKGNL